MKSINNFSRSVPPLPLSPYHPPLLPIVLNGEIPTAHFAYLALLERHAGICRRVRPVLFDGRRCCGAPRPFPLRLQHCLTCHTCHPPAMPQAEWNTGTARPIRKLRILQHFPHGSGKASFWTQASFPERSAVRGSTGRRLGAMGREGHLSPSAWFDLRSPSCCVAPIER